MKMKKNIIGIIVSLRRSQIINLEIFGVDFNNI